MIDLGMSSRTIYFQMKCIHQKRKKIIIYWLPTRWPASLQSCSVQILKLKDPPQAPEPKCMLHNARSYLNMGSRFCSKKIIGWHLHRAEDAILAEKTSFWIQDTVVLSKTVCCSSEPFLPRRYIWPISSFNQRFLQALFCRYGLKFQSPDSQSTDQICKQM